MKKTKIAFIVVLFLTGSIINIFSLINREETKTPIITPIKATITTETTTTSINIPTTKKTTKKVVKTTKKVVKSSSQVKSGTYKLTHYGPDCRGCSGVTASGYNVKNTIWYNDSEYGKLRVVATSRQFKMYSIIRIKDYKLGGDVTAIVLDRGVGSGIIDLLVKSEKAATQLGIQKVNIEVLRYGK